MERVHKTAEEIVKVYLDNGGNAEELLLAIVKKIDSSIDETPSRQKDSVDEEFETKMIHLLKQCGIPANIRGYGYLKQAIIYLNDALYIDKNTSITMTQELYPAVAEEFDTTPSRVDRAMRHAIEVAFSRGNSNMFDEVFGYSVDPDRGRPTISQFIYAAVDYLNRK